MLIIRAEHPAYGAPPVCMRGRSPGRRIGECALRPLLMRTLVLYLPESDFKEWMFTRDGQMDQSGKAYSTFIESTPTTFKGLTLHK